MEVTYWLMEKKLLQVVVRLQREVTCSFRGYLLRINTIILVLLF